MLIILKNINLTIFIEDITLGCIVNLKSVESSIHLQILLE